MRGTPGSEESRRQRAAPGSGAGGKGRRDSGQLGRLGPSPQRLKPGIAPKCMLGTAVLPAGTPYSDPLHLLGAAAVPPSSSVVFLFLAAVTAKKVL